MNAKEILAQSKAATAAIMPSTAKGGRKSSIYKEDIFQGLTKEEAKHSRTKLRNWVKQLLNGIANAEGENLTKLCESFLKLYKECYKVNDFSIASVASGNTDPTTKETYTKALVKVKAFTKGTTQEETPKKSKKHHSK